MSKKLGMQRVSLLMDTSSRRQRDWDAEWGERRQNRVVQSRVGSRGAEE